MKEQYEIHWTDYYDLFQVLPTAEIEVIEGAYKQLMLKYHPDRNPAAESAEKVKLLNEARAVLTDPARRAQYDEAYADHRPGRPLFAAKKIRQARKRLMTETNTRLERLRTPHLLLQPSEVDFGTVEHGETKTIDVRIRLSDSRMLIGDVTANRPWIKLSTHDLFAKTEVLQIAVDTHKLLPGRRYTGEVKVSTISYDTRVIPIALKLAGESLSTKYGSQYWKEILELVEPRDAGERQAVDEMSTQLRRRGWRPNTKQLALIQELKQRKNGKK
jgi:curved DNA-binding protein CbpA